MATATNAMVSIAWSQLTLGIIGLFGLGMTVNYARAAARAAIRSADESRRSAQIAERALFSQHRAAEKALGVARKAAARQTRAYVSVDEVQRTSGHEPLLEFGFVIRNSGQTPAYDAVVRSVIEIADQEGNPVSPLERQPGVFPLGPGGRHVYRQKLNKPLTPEQWEALIAGECRVYVHGTVSYMASYGKHRYTKFRFAYGRDNIGPGVLTICENGNEMR